jgi:hypothetical protein
MFKDRTSAKTLITTPGLVPCNDVHLFHLISIACILVRTACHGVANSLLNFQLDRDCLVR